MTAAERAYRDGRLHGALIVLARKARVAWGCCDVTVMTQALLNLTAAEAAAGVPELTAPTEDDFMKCSEKVRFETKAKAKRAARRLHHFGNDKVRPYRCPECRYFHLTSADAESRAYHRAVTRGGA